VYPARVRHLARSSLLLLVIMLTLSGCRALGPLIRPSGDTALDREYACEIAARFDPMETSRDYWFRAVDQAGVWELQALSSLLVAAGGGDQDAGLGLLGKQVITALNRIDTDAITTTMAAIQDACGPNGAPATPVEAGSAAAMALDRQYACEIAGRFAGVTFSRDDMPAFDDPVLWELQALSGLLIAASGGDRGSELAERGDRVIRAISRLRLDDLSQTLAEIAADCAA
jgi:hypothetical protein